MKNTRILYGRIKVQKKEIENMTEEELIKHLNIQFRYLSLDIRYWIKKNWKTNIDWGERKII